MADICLEHVGGCIHCYPVFTTVDQFQDRFLGLYRDARDNAEVLGGPRYGPRSAPDELMRRGPSSTDMEKLAHNGLDHRNGSGVASKPSDSRYRTVNLVAVGEALQAQYFAAR